MLTRCAPLSVRAACAFPSDAVDGMIIQDLLAREKRFTAPQLRSAVAWCQGAAWPACGTLTRRSMKAAASRGWIFLRLTVGETPGAGHDWRRVFDSARALAENKAEFEGTLKIGYSLLADLMHVLLKPSTEVVVNVDLGPRLKAGRLD